MNARDILAACRLRVVNRHPYLSDVVMSLRLVPKPGLGTLGVDAGWRLWYDPAIVEQWGPPGPGKDGVAAVVAHEVMHVILDHAGRRQGRDPAGWNQAADRSINPTLLAAGWRFPATPLLPKQIGEPDGETADHYYRAQEDKQQAQQGSQNGAGGAGQGQGGQSPDADSMPGCGGQCGGCAGHPHPHEEEGGEAGSGGDGKDGSHPVEDVPEPVSAADQQVLRRLAAEKTLQHSKTHGRGSVPGALVAWAEEELAPPRVPWQRVLARLVRSAVADRAGAVDYSYRRPARRAAGLRTVLGRSAPVLPSLRQPTPEVAIILDVSGSMGGGEGSPAHAARSEVLGIVRATGSPVITYAADTEVASVARVGGKRDLVRLGDTGGGTSMRAACLAVDRKHCRGVVIVITDGISDWPAPGECKARLIACVTPGGQRAPDHIPCVMVGV